VVKREIIHTGHHAAAPLIKDILKSDCSQLCRDIMWQLHFIKGRKPSPEVFSKINPILGKTEIHMPLRTTEININTY